MGDRYDRRRRFLAQDWSKLPNLAPFFVYLDGGEPNPRIRIGHNNGPPLEDGPSWSLHCWTKSHARAWKTPPIEVVRLRLARAQELGMTYKEYTAYLMDKGVWL